MEKFLLGPLKTSKLEADTVDQILSSTRTRVKKRTFIHEQLSGWLNNRNRKMISVKKQLS